MEPLSKSLENIATTATPDNSAPDTSQHGSIKKDGPTTSLTIIQGRPNPLTQSDLTQIMSKMLARPLSVSLKKKKGSEENQDWNNQDNFEVDLDMIFNPGLSRQLFEAALRMSPPAAILGHLQRLMTHKSNGRAEDHRALLLHDYADELRHYSDFVVYLVCRYFWSDHPGDFMPKIKPMKAICEAVHREISTRNLNLLGKPTNEPKPIRLAANRVDNPERMAICKFLTEKGEPDYLEMTHSHSNYHLERMASCKYGWKKSEE